MIHFNLTLPIQIINFLVTYWFLDHYLLRPIVQHILRRKQEERRLRDEIELKKRDLEISEQEKRDQLAQFQADTTTDYPFTPFVITHSNLPELETTQNNLSVEDKKALHTAVLRSVFKHD